MPKKTIPLEVKLPHYGDITFLFQEALKPCACQGEGKELCKSCQARFGLNDLGAVIERVRAA